MFTKFIGLRQSSTLLWLYILDLWNSSGFLVYGPLGLLSSRYLLESVLLCRLWES